MTRLQKQSKLLIPVIVILVAAMMGSIWLYREWRSNQIFFWGDYHGKHQGLYRLNLLYGKPILITPGLIADAKWSPDGNHIAFVSSADEIGKPPYHITVMNENGENIQQLTKGEVRHYSPTWSPDGKQIAYLSALDNGGGYTFAIFVMNSDGSAQRQITPYGNYYYLSWSPDGSKIAYSADGIYVMNIHGGKDQQLTNQWIDSFPVWSPDGEYIAFQSTRDSPNQSNVDLYIMRSDGTAVTRLTNNPAHDRQPSWSPDGKKIIFESNRDSDDWIYHIYIMNADGTEQKRITEMEGNAPHWRPCPRRETLLLC